MLTKAFGRDRRHEGEQALAGIDLQVDAGEFVVLLGPSGCGKTTLLRCIAGLEHPDRGSITIDGQVVFDADRRVNVGAERRPVSMIFQSYALWPHMTAGQNVAFPLRCRRVKREEIDRRVREMLAKVGIEHLAARYPSEMSGGQQQRLALARALVIGQRIVLLDEPLSNVDAQVRERLRLELIRMQRTLGFTAIYVTHDQSEALELADRIAVMRQGRIAQFDEPQEMYAAPRDVHVARFLGHSNEIQFVVEAFDQRTGSIMGTGSVGRLVASWGGGAEVAPPAGGEKLIAFARPTDLTPARVRDSIDEAGPSLPPNGNAWRGRIEAVRFLGVYTQYVVRIGEARVRCWVASQSRDGLAEGDDVTVSIGAPKLYAMRDP